MVIQVDTIPTIDFWHNSLPHVCDMPDLTWVEAAPAILGFSTEVHIDDIAGKDHVELVSVFRNVFADGQLILRETKLAYVHCVVFVKDSAHLTNIIVHLGARCEELGARLVRFVIDDLAIWEIGVLAHQVHAVDPEPINSPI